MNDADFLRALERRELAPAAFTHAAHLRAAYLYLRDLGFDAALPRIRRSIREYAAHLGQPDKYHETITVAYLALIQQRLLERGDGGGWAGFERLNADLFRRDLLLRHYRRAELESPLARRTFVLPSINND